MALSSRLKLGLMGAGFLAAGAVGVFVLPGPTYLAGPQLPICTNPGESPQFDGTQWQCRLGGVSPGDYRATHSEWAEEFIVAPSTNDAFTTLASGTGAGLAVTTLAGGNGARPGIASLATGTTTTGDIERRTSATLYPGDWTSTTYEATWGVSSQSSGTDEFAVVSGFVAAGSTITQTGGCFLIYDRANGAAGGINASNTHNLEAFAINSSTRTRVLLNGTSQDGTTGGAGSITTCAATVSAVTLPNTNFLTTKVVATPTSCQFYVGGSLCTTLTSNVPASGVALAAGTFMLKSVGTNSRTEYLDRHRLAVDLPSARSL